MISQSNAANAVGGKTARACDNCIKKRARWYCAADDAFLCQSCDGSVHSANPLARRHERVRLKTATQNKHIHELIVHSHWKMSSSSSSNSWHKGFTKKPRTPRNGKSGKLLRDSKPFPLVPEVGGDETSNEENDRDEFLLHRVPAYDPAFVVELCNSKDGDSAMNNFCGEIEAIDSISGEKGQGVDHMENLQGFLPTDADLAEFAADVESLLGRGLENESFGIEELGLMECKDGDIDGKRNGAMVDCSLSSSGQGVKLEEEEAGIVDGASKGEINMNNETFELSFDYDSPTCCKEELEGAVELEEGNDTKVLGGERNTDLNKKRKTILSLDYESVITAWAGQGSPWTSGDRPDFNSDDCLPDWMGICGSELQNGHYGEGRLYGGGHMGIGDTGREAKVSRYREKRRTRLFSKKIRYEVRKLNAEKRPRMKGRFVKRASFAPPPFPLLSK